MAPSSQGQWQDLENTAVIFSAELLSVWLQGLDSGAASQEPSAEVAKRGPHSKIRQGLGLIDAECAGVDNFSGDLVPAFFKIRFRQTWARRPCQATSHQLHGHAYVHVYAHVKPHVEARVYAYAYTHAYTLITRIYTHV